MLGLNSSRALNMSLSYSTTAACKNKIIFDSISFFYLSFVVLNFLSYNIFVKTKHYFLTYSILLVKNFLIYCKLLHILRLKNGNNDFSNCNAETVEIETSSKFLTIFQTCSFTLWIYFCPKNFCPINFLKHLQTV